MFSREDDLKIFKGIQNKNKVRGIMLPNFKAYSYSNQDAVVLAKDRHRSQIKGAGQRVEMYQQVQSSKGQLIFGKDAKGIK